MENRIMDLKKAFEPPPVGRRLNCDMTNDRAETALLAAAARSATHSISYLLTRGCNINAQDAEGNTCMHLACLNVDLEEAQLLYKRSCEIYHSLDTRKRAAALSAKEDAESKGLSKEAVARFVDNAVAAIERSEQSKWTNDYLLPSCPYALLDVNIPNLEGDTPLHIAADLGSQQLVEFLISIGADASRLNKGDLSPLERARLAKRDKVPPTYTIPRP